MNVDTQFTNLHAPFWEMDVMALVVPISRGGRMGLGLDIVREQGLATQQAMCAGGEGSARHQCPCLETFTAFGWSGQLINGAGT